MSEAMTQVRVDWLLKTQDDIARLKVENATLRAERDEAREMWNFSKKLAVAQAEHISAAEERLGRVQVALTRISNCYAVKNGLGARVYSINGNAVAVEIAEKALASLTEKPPAEPECDCSRARYPYPPPLPSHALNCATQAEKPPQPEPEKAWRCSFKGCFAPERYPGHTHETGYPSELTGIRS